MTSRQFIVQQLNNAGVGEKIATLKNAMLAHVLDNLSYLSNKAQNPDPSDETECRKRDFSLMLNSVGPAAAQSGIEFAVAHLRNTNTRLTGKYGSSDFTVNAKAILNESQTDLPVFQDVLRQYLLPRYSYMDFDRLVDPRHMIDLECGYPKFITPIMYRYMYDRDDMASRVNDIYPDESWTVEPAVFDTDDEEVDSPFEKGWEELCYKHNALHMLYRLDKLCGVGHYGVLLLGFDDGGDLEKPVAGIDPRTGERSQGSKPRQLLYMRPFDEYLSFILQYDTDTASPRYGLPVMYNLVFVDMTIDAAGVSIGTRVNRKVHWTRVLHAADNLSSGPVFGIPRMQQVFNRLLDLRKIKGGSAEMLWKGGFPGIAFEIDPQFVADDPEFDQEDFKREVEKYADGLQRYLTLVGIKANTLAPAVADPEPHVRIQLAAIAANKGIPLRIFLGSEEARLASSEDKLTWNRRLGRRLRTFVEPGLLRNFINRMIAMGVLPPPENDRYRVEWPDLNSSTDEDKANLSLKVTQALSQYVATGIIHLVQPLDYMMFVLHWTPSLAKKINDQVMKQGGYTMLLKVDPSQAAGVNGKRQNIASDDDSADAGKGRTAQRDTATKSAEGKTS